MSEQKNPQHICIVGNIGSGKSTLTKVLAEAIPNSIAALENFDQNAFLELFIKNPGRWAFTNAVRYFFDYVRVYREAAAGKSFQYCFMDAGGATNRGLYGNYLRQEGVMTADEHAFYELLCDIITRAYAYPQPDAYIFLRVAPEQCFERMKQRGWRYQTENIALEYLNTLQRYITLFYEALRGKNSPVLELDSTRIDFTRAKGQAEVIERVRAFLENKCGF